MAGSPEIDRSIVLAATRSVAAWVFGVSVVINLLMLTGPMYMLQVYDRVLASGSLQTLLVLSLFALVLYLFFGALEYLRSRVMTRLAHKLDSLLAGHLFQQELEGNHGRRGNSASVSDGETLRQFVSGPGCTAIFDVPWTPVFLAVVFLFHPVLGFTALGGMVAVGALVLLNELLSRQPAKMATAYATQSARHIDDVRRNADVVTAMGATQTLRGLWEDWASENLARQRHALDINTFFAAATKMSRLILQSLILGVGAYLALNQEITPGVMIAASIITARAMAPIDLATAHWRSFVSARQAFSRIVVSLDQADRARDELALPLPHRAMSCEQISCAPRGVAEPVITDISFELQAGDGLGIIGPTGSGKSTLAQALVGLSDVKSGCIRFDGAERHQWPNDSIGRFIGYLPQDVQLMNGTIRQNISRFSEGDVDDLVIAAAKLADVHELIVSLPDGYNTRLSGNGLGLSGGQRQRIALARAVYGRPFLVVLDEPNSSLDADGDQALNKAIHDLRQSGSVVVIVAHRPSATSAVDLILVLDRNGNGEIGPRAAIIERLVARPRKEAV